jgi:hypothetical protein
VKEEQVCPNVSVKEEHVGDQIENQKQATTFGIFFKRGPLFTWFWSYGAVR